MDIATTVASSARHLLQRIRFPTASKVADDPHSRASGFRCCYSTGPACAGDLNEEVTQRIVQFLDAWQYPHSPKS
jgi:hypothetical protein